MSHIMLLVNVVDIASILRQSQILLVLSLGSNNEGYGVFVVEKPVTPPSLNLMSSACTSSHLVCASNIMVEVYPSDPYPIFHVLACIPASPTKYASAVSKPASKTTRMVVS